MADTPDGPTWRIELLTQHHDRRSFVSGQPSLDEFRKRSACMRWTFSQLTKTRSPSIRDSAFYNSSCFGNGVIRLIAVMYIAVVIGSRL